MTFPATDIGKLYDPFAERDIHWRAQSVTKDGTKAMALAYIDARNVMERLDAVCGPENWEDSYHETEKGRLICTLRINVDGVWIAKSDGAGESDIEGEKGAISGAFKRAAVKWGIGRYLYDMPTPWVPCDSYSYEDRGKKKYRWSAWKDDPWKHVRGAPTPVAPKPAEAKPAPVISDEQRDELTLLAQAANVTLLDVCRAAKVADLKDLPADKYDSVKRKLNLTIQANTEKKEAA